MLEPNVFWNYRKPQGGVAIKTGIRVEDKFEEIKSLNGIFNVKASHNKSNVITMYENEILSENEIKKAIKKAGYSTSKNSISQFLCLGSMVIIMLYLSSNSLVGYDTNSLLSNASLIISKFTIYSELCQIPF